jgi:hypothetical protein
MTLEELYAEWAKDAHIDKTEAGDASLAIPQLVAKYLKLLSVERLRGKALVEKRNGLEQKLRDYFDGVITGPEIGRPDFQLVKGTRGATDKRIAADPEMVQLNLQAAMSDEKLLYLKDVLHTINQRSFQISNYIKWLQFTSGSGM